MLEDSGAGTPAMGLFQEGATPSVSKQARLEIKVLLEKIPAVVLVMLTVE
jgi:hypothetical protein